MLDNESISNIEGYDEDFKKNQLIVCGIFLAIQLILSIGSFVILYLYYPQEEIFIIIPILITITAIINIMWLITENKIIKSVAFIINCLTLCGFLISSILMLIQLSPLYNQLWSKILMAAQIFEFMIQGYVSFYSYLRSNQINFIRATHIFNVLFLIFGMKLYILKQGLTSLFMTIGLSVIIYFVCFKKVKVAFFSSGILLLIYLLFNQILHFMIFRNQESFSINIMMGLQQTFGYALMALLLFISDKPPFLNQVANELDIIAGGVILLLLIIFFIQNQQIFSQIGQLNIILP
ncbi:hypothetical protein pb186bvf_007042 [Paramecium bursaria]